MCLSMPTKKLMQLVAHVAHDANGHRDTTLICSKTKVGLNKSISIPRMELKGAVIGTWLVVMMKEQHIISFSRRN